MNTNLLLTLLIAAALIFYVLYRQIVKRPVSQRDLLLPLIAAV